MWYTNKKGQKVGELKDGIFRKKVSGSKHLLKMMDAWGIDKYIVEELKKQEVEEIRIKDIETDSVYKTSLDVFLGHSVERNFGAGEQLFLSRKFFDRIDLVWTNLKRRWTLSGSQFHESPNEPQPSSWHTTCSRWGKRRKSRREGVYLLWRFFHRRIRWIIEVTLGISVSSTHVFVRSVRIPCFSIRETPTSPRLLQMDSNTTIGGVWRNPKEKKHEDAIRYVFPVWSFRWFAERPYSVFEPLLLLQTLWAWLHPSAVRVRRVVLPRPRSKSCVRWLRYSLSLAWWGWFHSHKRNFRLNYSSFFLFHAALPKPPSPYPNQSGCKLDHNIRYLTRTKRYANLLLRPAHPV